MASVPDDSEKSSNGTRPNGDPEKDQITGKEVVHDHDVLGGSNVTKEDAIHSGTLTAEELEHEKKLRKIIDSLIMPLVMLVSWNGV